MYKIKLHKTSECLLPVHIDMLWKNFFFDVFINFFPKIHISVLCKITIDLLYFWDAYDVIYEKKNYGRSTVYKAEAVLPITYFKAAVIGRSFSKIVALQCSFLAFVKALRNVCDRFDLVVSLSVPPACYFTKGWTPCQIIYKVYDHKSSW